MVGFGFLHCNFGGNQMATETTKKPVAKTVTKPAVKETAKPVAKTMKEVKAAKAEKEVKKVKTAKEKKEKKTIDTLDVITKRVIMKAVAEKYFSSRKDAEVVIDEIFEIMQKALLAGKKIRIDTLGRFTMKQTKEHNGRNPLTGETVVVKAKKVDLRRALNE